MIKNLTNVKRYPSSNEKYAWMRVSVIARSKFFDFNRAKVIYNFQTFETFYAAFLE